VYIIREEGAKKYLKIVTEEAKKLDPETCEVWCQGNFHFDPYGLYAHRKPFLQFDDWDKKVV